MTFGSLFTGIGGFDLGFERAGWECAWQVEIEPRACLVLKRHWPAVRRFDDVAKYGAAVSHVRPRLICGGFPCQDLSVAGRRAGLAGKRSGLFYEFMRVVREIAPRWVLIENVPGLLSSNGGRDMGAVLGTLEKLGYGAAYRVLDAQWFGVAQRRRRVFIVGCARADWRRAAKVLFEPESLPWDSPPRREAGADVAGSLERSSHDWSRADISDMAITPTLARSQTTREGRRHDDSCETLIAFDTTNVTSAQNRSNPQPGDLCHTLATGQHAPAVAYQCHGSNVGAMGTLRAGNGNESGGVPFVATDYAAGSYAESSMAGTLTQGTDATRGRPIVVSTAVRRLTPCECERLQGFPDDWTRLDSQGNAISDTARYRMLGNAVAVPVAEWLARRVRAAEGDE